MEELPLLLFRPRPGEGIYTKRLSAVLAYALDGVEVVQIHRETDLPVSRGRKILFAVDLGKNGINPEYYAFLKWLRSHPEGLTGCTAGILVDGESNLYTKSVASELVFSANLAGCAFVGRPLVEGTGTLGNFQILAEAMETDEFGAYLQSARFLVEQLLDEPFPRKERPRLLALHASNHWSSNTLDLWREIRKEVEKACEIQEINLRNGTISDCAGCPYTACLHFGERGGCFYGGVMVDEVYPALKEADALLLLCPNYNDALSANLTAFVNRLTALFRQTRFYEKALFAVIVSGYSGSDLLARQIIAALNMNKSFYLPGHFAMLETANDTGSARKLPGISGRIHAFSQNLLLTISKEKTVSPEHQKTQQTGPKKLSGPVNCEREVR